MKYKIIKKQKNSGHCFVCGAHNQHGLLGRFYHVQKNEEEEQILLGIFIPQNHHQSYPGRMHGGISATILDESIGRAVTIINPDIWGVTIDLSVKYRKPVPLDETLYSEARITKVGFRAFEGEGKLFRANGEVCATGTGKFMILPPEKIAPEAITPENWFSVPDGEDAPEEILIVT